MMMSTAVQSQLLKRRFVYSPLAKRFYQMFKTTPPPKCAQRIIRRKNEYWLSDVQHADTTTETMPSSAQAAAVHLLLLGHQ
jgi:hypothetical protein